MLTSSTSFLMSSGLAVCALKYSSISDRSLATDTLYSAVEFWARSDASKTISARSKAESERCLAKEIPRRRSSAEASFRFRSFSVSSANFSVRRAVFTRPSLQESPPHLPQPAPPQYVSQGSPRRSHTCKSKGYSGQENFMEEKFYRSIESLTFLLYII